MLHLLSIQIFFFDDNITVDVRFVGDTATLVRKKHWTATEIEEQVSQFSYTGENLPRDPEVEKPSSTFALAFYKFIFLKGAYPTNKNFGVIILSNTSHRLTRCISNFYGKEKRISVLAESTAGANTEKRSLWIRDFLFYYFVKNLSYLNV